MTELRWVPRWLAAWADRDPNLRTAIPFVPLAFLLVLGSAGMGCKRPLRLALTVGGACLAISEFGQLFLPHRSADVKDLMWGGLGILLGAGIAWGCGKLNRAK